MHLTESDPLGELRKLRAKRTAGIISHAEYIDAFNALNAAHERGILCTNDDGRHAATIVAGRPLCAPCYLREKRR